MAWDHSFWTCRCLACGLFALLAQRRFLFPFRTNVREDAAPYEHSRGELASSFLLADDRLSVEEYATNLAATSQKYAGFNLLLFAPNLLSSPSPQSTTTLDASQSQPASGGTTMDALLVTNHGGGGRLIHRRLTQAECACAGISNGVDGTGGWAKVVGGTRDLQEVVDAAASEPTAQAREAALVNGILRTLSLVVFSSVIIAVAEQHSRTDRNSATPLRTGMTFARPSRSRSSTWAACRHLLARMVRQKLLLKPREPGCTMRRGSRRSCSFDETEGYCSSSGTSSNWTRPARSLRRIYLMGGHGRRTMTLVGTIDCFVSRSKRDRDVPG